MWVQVSPTLPTAEELFLPVKHGLCVHGLCAIVIGTDLCCFMCSSFSDPANLGPSPLLSSPHTLTPGRAERHPNADSPLTSHLLTSTDSASEARQQRSEATSSLPLLHQNTPPLSVTRMSRQVTHDGSIHLEYRPSTSPSPSDSSPLLAVSKEKIGQSLSSVEGEIEGSMVPTPPQSPPGSGSATPSAANSSESEHTPCPTPLPTTDHIHEQLSQHDSRDSNSLLQTSVRVGETDNVLLKATHSSLYQDDDTPPFLKHTQRKKRAVTYSKSDSVDKSDASDKGGPVLGGSTDTVEPLRYTPDAPPVGEDDMFLLTTPPTPFKEMSAFDADSPEDGDLLSAFRDSRRSSPGNVSEVSLISVISSLHGGREGDISADVSDRSHLDTSLVPQPTKTGTFATPNRQSLLFDSMHSTSDVTTPRVDPSSESLLLFTPAPTATHMKPGDALMSGLLLDDAPAPPERTQGSSSGYSFVSLLGDTPAHSSGVKDLLTGTPLPEHSSGRGQGRPTTAPALLATHTPSPLYGAALMNQTPSTAKGARAAALQQKWQDRSVDSPLLKGL